MMATYRVEPDLLRALLDQVTAVRTLAWLRLSNVREAIRIGIAGADDFLEEAEAEYLDAARAECETILTVAEGGSS